MCLYSKVSSKKCMKIVSDRSLQEVPEIPFCEQLDCFCLPRKAHLYQKVAGIEVIFCDKHLLEAFWVGNVFLGKWRSSAAGAAASMCWLIMAAFAKLWSWSGWPCLQFFIRAHSLPSSWPGPAWLFGKLWSSQWLVHCLSLCGNTLQ